MDDALYREEILQHYKRPHNFGPMEAPDREAFDTNPLCGDELRVMLKVDDNDVVEEVRFEGHGCAISQASASMISDEINGMKLDDLARLDRSAILDLLAEIQRDTGIACLFISHDLAVVRAVADRVAVMERGHIVETGPTAEIIANPRHAATRALLAAAPRLNPVPQGATA